MMEADTFVAQVTPYNEAPVTAVFDTTGMAGIIEPLADSCNWSVSEEERSWEDQTSVEAGSTKRIDSAERELVREIQELLKNSGYKPGPVDGIVGEQTLIAVKEYQATHGMEANGNVDNALLESLRSLEEGDEGQIIAEHVRLIREKIVRNWNMPLHSQRGKNDDALKAHVNVQVAPSGEVESAHIVKSSGDPVFDRSVENAVLKASPLPLPTDSNLVERFQDLTLTLSGQ